MTADNVITPEAVGHAMTIVPADDCAWTDRLQIECECGDVFELGASPSLMEALMAAHAHVEDVIARFGQVLPPSTEGSAVSERAPKAQT